VTRRVERLAAAAAVNARRSNPPSLPVFAIRLEPGIVRLAFAALAVSLVQRRARPNACAARPPCRDHSLRSSTLHRRSRWPDSIGRSLLPLRSGDSLRESVTSDSDLPQDPTHRSRTAASARSAGLGRPRFEPFEPQRGYRRPAPTRAHSCPQSPLTQPGNQPGNQPTNQPTNQPHRQRWPGNCSGRRRPISVYDER